MKILKGISSSATAGIFIVGILIGAAAIYVAAPSLGLGSVSTKTVGGGTATTTILSTVTATGATGLSGTIPIGFLDDLSSGLAFQGVRSNVTSRLAIADINSWLASNGANFKFSISIQDYALDTTKALTAMGAFKAQGIQVVIGPLNSGTAGGILQFANSNHIVLISPSSTSPALAIPNDYLFRTAPNDIAQGAADARIMYQSGARAAIIVYRQDSYGNGLANTTGARFTALGGTVVDKIPYDATSADAGTLDYTAVLQKMSSDWSSATATYGANKVAIYEINFGEISNLLIQAQKSFPSLLTTPLPWFGDDGWAADFTLTGNSTVAPLVNQIRAPSTIFGYTNTTRTNDVCTRMLAQAHLGCESYSLGAYDDVWLAALSIIACGKNDGTCIQKTISTVANNYFGATGWTALQPSGDRLFGDYLIWCVATTPSGVNWIICGSWSQLSDSVTWTHKPAGVAG